MYTTAVNTC